MIYTTGSIAVSGNTLTGTGTNFTQAGSLIRTGCTVLALTSPAQAFQITAIESATSLTVTPAASPAIPAGTKFAILLSDSLSVDGLAQDIAETFTMYQRYMGGFADVMNGAGDVTITINGQPVTVPGQKSLAKKGANSDITSLSGMTTALSIEQGGTGAKTKADARLSLSAASSGANSDITSLGGLTTALSITQGGTGAKTASDARGSLGLGSASTKNTGTGLGDVMEVGAFSLGTDLSSAPSNSGLYPVNRFIQIPSAGGNNPVPGTGGVGLNFALSANYGFHLLASIGGTARLFGQSVNTQAGFGARVEFYSTGNTTRAADGSVKAASPIVRIVKSKEDCTRPDIDEADFEWCGAGVANAEAEGVTLTREATGVYLLEGSAGLAKSGWQMSPPRDPQGSGDMGIVEAEQAEDGSLIVRLYKRRYVLSEDGDIELQKGVAIDVPPTSWIDVRLDMPENSIWNQRAESVQEE
ncbi:phage tail protein [Kosakonia cowanii]|uniref:phage tail fiber protein n=1 Tax=Kosakonia cowanii TaxID=208223 RepID=UPI00307641FA